MKVTIDQKILDGVVSKVKGPAKNKSPVPACQHLLLEAFSVGELRVTSNDLHVSLSGAVPAEVATSGSVTVPAKAFSKIVAKLPAEKVALEAEENNYLKASCGRVRYRIAGGAAADFPDGIVCDDAQPFSVPGKILSEMIGAVIHAASTDESRSHLCAVQLTVDNGILRMVATDGHQLAVAENAVADLPPNASALLPLGFLKESQSLLGVVGDSSVEVQLSESSVVFSVKPDGESVVLAGKLTAASFPPWRKVVPQEFGGKLKVSRKDLIDAVSRARLVAGGSGSEAIILNTSPEGSLFSPDGSLTVSGESPEVGESREELIAYFDGPDAVKSGFNGKYLLNILKVMKSDEVTIRINGVVEAYKFEGGGDDPFGILMPIRL